jgi:hypothetical protein
METKKIQKVGITSLQNSIGVSDCVKGTALVCHGNRVEYTTEIGKGLGKMFFLHGKTYNSQAILNFTEAIIETYKYETPETILLFLKKAANGDFGKFYGEPDIGTLREWFTDFLGKTIVPAREHEATRTKERYDNQREQKKSLRDVIEGPLRPVK